MDDALVTRFIEDGFVKIEGAFARRTAEDCARLLWRETGCDPADPGTWDRPVHWVSDMAQGPFSAAPNSPVLHEAYDLLVGPGPVAAALLAGQLPAAVPASRGAGRRGLAHRRQLSARGGHVAVDQPPLQGPRPADAVPVQRGR